MNNPQLSKEINGALVDFEKWCETNKDADVESFIRQRGLPTAVSGGLRKTIELEKQVNRVVAVNQCTESTGNAASSDLSGKVLGNYRFLRRLGVGGMGTVWLAEQEEPVRREIAIKLIRPELSSDVFVKRFNTERQALATMSHPNIAKVLDAGTFEQNRPYFVMEYVPGIPITDYCNKHRHSLIQRLELFLQCCEAIQHAHQKSLLHRDIKPNNVLVFEIDGKPNVKVIDFGLSKFLSNDTLKDPQLTLADAVLGSPLWMSPEQAGGRGGKSDPGVDTRSDIYSLGVILYQLMTNTTPITLEFYRDATPAQLLQAIQEAIPPNPSVRLAQQDDTTNWISQHTNSSFSSWSNMLRNDLDWVTMKALEKERDRRYASVTALADDVQRFMNSEPVVARPPSAIYRAKKLLRKHRGAALTTTIFAVLLFAATVISAWLAVWAINERAVADRERGIADRERARSDQTVDFVVRSFGQLNVSNPGVEYNEMKKDFLYAIRDEINRTDFDDDPLKESSFREALAESLSGSGLHQDSIVEFERVVSLNQQLLGAEDESTISAKTLLAFEYLKINENKKAQKIAEECQAIAIQNYHQQHEVLIGAKVAWNRARLQQREYDEVVANLGSLIPVAESSLGESHPHSIEATAVLTEALINKQRYNEAGKLSDKARQLATRKWGAGHQRTIELEVLHWKAYARDSRFKKSPELLNDFLKELGGKFGPGHPVTLRLQDECGQILLLQHRTQLAHEVYNRNLEDCQTWLGPRHPQTAKAIWGLVLAHGQARQYKKSSEMIRKAIPVFSALYGAKSKEVLKCYCYLAKNCFYDGDREKALEIATKYVQIAIDEIGRDDEVTFELMDLRIRSLSELGQYGLAIQLFHDSWERSCKKDGPGSAQAGHLLFGLATVNFLAGNYDDAVEYYDQAYKIFESEYGHGYFNTHLLIQMYTNALLHQKLYARTEALANKTLNNLEPEMTNSKTFVLTAQAGLANAYVGQAKYEEAQKVAEQIVALPIEDGDFNFERAQAKSAMAVCLQNQKEYLKAEALLKEALEAYESGPLEKPFVWYKIRCCERFVALYEAWEKPGKATQYRLRLSPENQ